MPRESRIIAVDGKPVSHIRIIYDHLSIYGVRIKTASLGGVCTDPEFRGRGIATRLLDSCIDEATRAGAKLLIISGDRGLYLRAQAAIAGPVWETRIVRREHGDSEQALTVRAAGIDDAPALSRLHQAEPVRYVRSGDFFARMLRHGHRQPWLIESGATGRSMRARKHRAVIPSDFPRGSGEAGTRGRRCRLRFGGTPGFASSPIRFLRSRPERGDSLQYPGAQPIAYLSLSRIWDLPSAAPIRALAEYAGSRAALIDSLPSLLDAAGLAELRVSFPTHDTEMTHLFRSRGVSLRRDTVHAHTYRLLDLPGLMRALRPYLAARLPASALRAFSITPSPERLSPADERPSPAGERISPAGEGVSPAAGERVHIRFGSEQADLSLSEAAAIMFGGPTAPAIGGDLGQILHRLFPIPLPLPGLNYV